MLLKEYGSVSHGINLAVFYSSISTLTIRTERTMFFPLVWRFCVLP